MLISAVRSALALTGAGGGSKPERRRSRQSRRGRYYGEMFGGARRNRHEALQGLLLAVMRRPAAGRRQRCRPGDSCRSAGRPSANRPPRRSALPDDTSMAIRAIRFSRGSRPVVEDRSQAGTTEAIAMRKTAVIAIMLGVAGAASAANAMPVSSFPINDAPLISTIAYGCGPGMTRGPAGYCRPRFTCPPGWHPGPAGWHCFRNRW